VQAVVPVAQEPAARRPVLIALALAAVYLIWGSSYFAMRVVLPFLPPFLMSGGRFLIAGGVLYAVLRARGAAAPRPREWAAAAVVGVLLLSFGNALVAVAERTIESGVAATVIATVPLWTAAFAALFGERPTLFEGAGLLLGFIGIAVLQSGGSLTFGGWDALALCAAPVFWAFGSAWSKRLPLPSGLMATAAEMIAGGAVLLALAVARGDRPLQAPTFATAGAFLYLIAFGSLVAFSAFGYLLRNTRPAIAMSYAYVNPLVALLIGAILGGELLTPAKLLACAITVCGVALAALSRRRPAGA
jgi:drug/metabolite transporter (DMT)-like permease